MFINVLDEVKALASNLGFAALTGKEVAQLRLFSRSARRFTRILDRSPALGCTTTSFRQYTDRAISISRRLKAS